MLTVALPHTGLVVPVPRPVISELTTVDREDGQAFRAQVWWDGEHVGQFENLGTGGQTVFRPTESSRVAGSVRMDRFAAACTHLWLPVSRSMVFTLLVEEHDHAELVRAAVAHGGTAARFLVGGLPIGVFAEVDLTPGRWADLAADVDLLRGMEPDGGFTGTWQVWDGEGWRDLVAALGDRHSERGIDRRALAAAAHH